MVYLPEFFVESDQDAIFDLIESHPLGLMVTTGSQGIVANLLPFVLDRNSGEHGRLLTHVARNNPVWHDHDLESGALIVFQPVDCYITPNWYPTKQTTHEVVPTWNYAMVQARGEMIVHDDLKWVRGQCGQLTKNVEASEPIPWKMADAPRAYTEEMLTQIVGLEIPVDSLIGKVKASQNRLPEDAAGAVAGLRARGTDADRTMADLIERARGWQTPDAAPEETASARKDS